MIEWGMGGGEEKLISLKFNYIVQSSKYEQIVLHVLLDGLYTQVRTS